MGLFGGFKAKFTRTSRSKDNTSEQIVCTKYRIHSEFHDDAPVVFKHNPRVRLTKPKRQLEVNGEELASSKQHSKSLSNINNIDKTSNKNALATPRPIRKAESASTLAKTSNEPISKTRPPYPLPKLDSRPEVQHDYDEPSSPFNTAPVSFKRKDEDATKDKAPPLPKSQPPLHKLKDQNEYDEPDENIYKFSSTFNVPSNTTSILSSKFTLDRNTKKLPNGDIQTREVISTNSLYLEGSLNPRKPFFTTTTDDYEDITPVEEYKVTFPEDDKDLEPSTLILMTQPSVDNSSTPGTVNKTFQFGDGCHDNEDDFKVNVVKYDLKRNYSMSEDEISTDGLIIEESNAYTPMGCSSQAASIFFGVDMKPPMETSNPRQVVLQKATNEEEEDC